jgi:hypothetical protein
LRRQLAQSAARGGGGGGGGSKVFCICKTPWADEDARDSIYCSFCKDWLHCDCVGLDPNEMEFIKNYACPACVAMGVGEVTLKTAKQAGGRKIMLGLGGGSQGGGGLSAARERWWLEQLQLTATRDLVDPAVSDSCISGGSRGADDDRLCALCDKPAPEGCAEGPFLGPHPLVKPPRGGWPVAHFPVPPKDGGVGAGRPHHPSLVEQTSHRELASAVQAGKRVWVHRNCALFAAESWQEAEEMADAAPPAPRATSFMPQHLHCVGQAINRRGGSNKCTRCAKRGATVGCQLAKCKRNYHFGCAAADFQAAGLPISQDFYCPVHAVEFGGAVPEAAGGRSAGSGGGGGGGGGGYAGSGEAAAEAIALTEDQRRARVAMPRAWTRKCFEDPRDRRLRIRAKACARDTNLKHGVSPSWTPWTPQVGDRLLYFPAGHEAHARQHPHLHKGGGAAGATPDDAAAAAAFPLLPWEQTAGGGLGALLPSRESGGCAACRLVQFQFKFPPVSPGAGPHGAPPLYALLTLELASDSKARFEVAYTPAEASGEEFLLPQSWCSAYKSGVAPAAGQSEPALRVGQAVRVHGRTRGANAEGEENGREAKVIALRPGSCSAEDGAPGWEWMRWDAVSVKWSGAEAAGGDRAVNLWQLEFVDGSAEAALQTPPVTCVCLRRGRSPNDVLTWLLFVVQEKEEAQQLEKSLATLSSGFARLCQFESAQDFFYQVTEEVAEGYTATVPSPMDLSLIQDRITNRYSHCPRLQ